VLWLGTQNALRECKKVSKLRAALGSSPPKSFPHRQTSSSHCTPHQKTPNRNRFDDRIQSLIRSSLEHNCQIFAQLLLPSELYSDTPSICINMSFLFGGGRPQPTSEQKLAAAEAEVEMVSDMFNRYGCIFGNAALQHAINPPQPSYPLLDIFPIKD
jgi:hypothetical protein